MICLLFREMNYSLFVNDLYLLRDFGRNDWFLNVYMYNFFILRYRSIFK